MGKRKRLRNKRRVKDRSTTIVLDMGRPVALTGATFASDGSLRVFAADGPSTPECASIETTYPRAKGPKILNRANIDPRALVVHPNDVLAQYLWTFAVDTNQPSDAAVAFTGVVQAQVATLGRNTYRLGIVREAVIELHNVEFPAERFGWWLVIRSIVNRPAGARIALVVDSELSNLPAINRREQPIVGTNYLPEGFELLYASGERGREFIASELLRRADHNARDVAQLWRRDDVAKPPVMPSSDGGTRSYIRVWERQRPHAQ